jgi:hypothetical protein
MEKASEQGEGTPGAVEPMVLMVKTIFYCPRPAIYSVFFIKPPSSTGLKYKGK